MSQIGDFMAYPPGRSIRWLLLAFRKTLAHWRLACQAAFLGMRREHSTAQNLQYHAADLRLAL
jgi:hypothetical protein